MLPTIGCLPCKAANHEEHPVSYRTINLNANDVAFQGRLTAACAQEGVEPDPSTAMYAMRWDVASKSDIEAAYASALAAGNPDPGGDEMAITDGMILAAVQSLAPAP
jgi:hypothetical protein